MLSYTIEKEPYIMVPFFLTAFKIKSREEGFQELALPQAFIIISL
jgi:hypothetical protein